MGAVMAELQRRFWARPTSGGPRHGGLYTELPAHLNERVTSHDRADSSS
jgi:hypothetical protein